MLRLYKFSEAQNEYWETWRHGCSRIVHWGHVGSEGKIKKIKSTRTQTVEERIALEIQMQLANGFEEKEGQCVLLVEYAIEGFITPENLKKRHHLEERMNEALGWRGLGRCDGGSIGSNVLELCNLVVDFELAKSVIERDLAGTEFSNYTRIYSGN